jgi:hypothetical protein
VSLGVQGVTVQSLHGKVVRHEDLRRSHGNQGSARYGQHRLCSGRVATGRTKVQQALGPVKIILALHTDDESLSDTTRQRLLTSQAPGAYRCVQLCENIDAHHPRVLCQAVHGRSACVDCDLHTNQRPSQPRTSCPNLTKLMTRKPYTKPSYRDPSGVQGLDAVGCRANKAVSPVLGPKSVKPRVGLLCPIQSLPHTPTQWWTRTARPYPFMRGFGKTQRCALRGRRSRRA